MPRIKLWRIWTFQSLWSKECRGYITRKSNSGLDSCGSVLICVEELGGSEPSSKEDVDPRDTIDSRGADDFLRDTEVEDEKRASAIAISCQFLVAFLS